MISHHSALRPSLWSCLIFFIALSLGLGYVCYRLKLEVGNLNAEKTTLLDANSNLQQQNNELQSKLRALEQENEQLKSISALRRATHQMPTERTAYLTFDDGPSENTIKILDILKKYNVKATFFVCGNTTKLGTSVYRRIVQEGHAIGNHTFSHDYAAIYKSPEDFWADVVRLERLLYEATGQTTRLLRFPGGSNNQVSWKFGGKDLMKQLVEQALARGYQFDDWNVSSLDAACTCQNRDVIVSSVLNQARTQKAAIILMHDSSAKTTTVEALPDIIEGLKKMGFKFSVLGAHTFAVHFIN